MKVCYCKSNLESAGYTVHGLGLLSAIGQKYGHTSVWFNAAQPKMQPLDFFVAEEPDIVAITACSDAYPAAVALARAAKAAKPDSIVCVGGPHATFAPDDFARHSEFDFIIRGEGESVWEALCVGRFPSQRIVSGGSPRDLDALPFVDRLQDHDFVNGTEHPPLPLHAFPGPYRCVLAGRGCRFNCRFCKPGTSLIFGKKNRRRSVQHVMDELGTLQPFGSLFIHDDNLTEDEVWCREFVECWDGRPFLIQSHPYLISKQEDLLSQMARKGLRCMLVGFESGSDATLKRMRKGTTRDVNIKAASILKRLGIAFQANMIFGTPGETKEDVLASIDLINRYLKPCTLSLCVYTPYPGSEWAEECNAKGWNLVRDSYDYGRGIGGRKLKEEAFGYTYDWLYDTLKAV